MNKTKLSILLSNIRPGDILLHRRKKDPVRQKTDSGIFGYWRNAYLCLENERVVCCAEGICFSVLLPMLLEGSEDSYALFRLRDELEEGQFEQIVEGMIEVLKIDFNGFHFKFTQEELICIGYKNIGVTICDGPEWRATPIDFDRSSSIVRVV